MSRNKPKGTSYVLTLEARLDPVQRRRLHSGEEVARQIENTCKGLLLKHLRGLRGDPQWRKTVERLKELSAKGKLTNIEKAEKKALSVEMHDLKLKYRLTENQMHEEAAKINKHFGSILGISKQLSTKVESFIVTC